MRSYIKFGEYVNVVKYKRSNQASILTSNDLRLKIQKLQSVGDTVKLQNGLFIVSTIVIVTESFHSRYV